MTKDEFKALKKGDVLVPADIVAPVGLFRMIYVGHVSADGRYLESAWDCTGPCLLLADCTKWKVLRLSPHLRETLKLHIESKDAILHLVHEAMFNPNVY